MIFSYNFLQSFFEKKLPQPEKLADLLVMHFFEVEAVEKRGKDTVIDIDILPSRAGDCFSHKGVAREISAITGLKCKFPEVKIKEKKEIADYVDVEVRDACHRYTLRVIDNVKVGPSPSFIQERLISCGLKPINNIVDITNYVMLETGQPLHAFDADKVEGRKVIVRYAKKREKIVTLDEKRFELDDDILIISDEVSPIGIAGIKGGVIPEIDHETKTIFLESANFNRLVIRRGARKLNMRTDASVRFEHGMSISLTEEAIDRAASMIEQFAKGDVIKGRVDIVNKKEKNLSLKINIEDVKSVLGVDVSLGETERILLALGFKVKRNGVKFNVEVPLFRRDVKIKEDLIEEIGRVYGYKNIKPTFPCDEILPPKENYAFSFKKKCIEEMRALRFTEVYRHSFVDDKVVECFGYKNLQEMEKPVSLDFKYLRPSLVPGVLGSISDNEKVTDKLDIFELGNVFYGLKEEKMLCGASFPSTFLEMKGRLKALLEKLFIEDISYSPKTSKYLYNCAEIRSDKEVIGIIGDVSLRVRRAIGIKSPVALFELSIGELEKITKKRSTYNPILRFPEAVRDISLLVPQETKYEDVVKKIKKEGGALLREVSLFDLYQGEEIPREMKSFAFRLLFQASNKTLSSEEANSIRDKIIKSLEQNPGWKVRK